MSFDKIFNREKIKSAIKDDLISAYENRVINKLDIFRNTLDPFSAVLDSKLLNKDIESWINEVEIPRQDQKTIQNIVGTLHQKIIGTIKDWEDLDSGMVVDNKNDKTKIVAEVKNKHNTTKGNHKKEIYDDLKGMIEIKYPGYTGYYVEILPKNGKIYNEEFTPPDNVTKKRRPANKNIRKIDGKSFYALVTGKKDALEELYDEFPKLIDEILEEKFNDYCSVDLGSKRKEIFKKIFPKTKIDE